MCIRDSPKAAGRRSLNCYLSGLTEEQLKKERLQVIKATQEDIRALAVPVAASLQKHNVCVIGNEEKIKKEQQVFDEILPLL